MLMAAALVAMQWEEVARRAGVGVLRISFAKVYQKASALCELVALGADLIPPDALAALVERESVFQRQPRKPPVGNLLLH